MDTDATGTLDEALLRLHATGPEFEGWLSNHGTMAVEALARWGQAGRVHRWVDAYARRLEEPPAPYERITADNWRRALGDPRHLADWTAYFTARLVERPWREVLATWWPRLLPGIAAGATHPVIRVGHAVRVLLGEGENAPRVAELAHGLGYWAARHQPLPSDVAALPAPTEASGALRAVPRVADQSGGINGRLAQITALPAWGGGIPEKTEAAEDAGEAVLAAAERSSARLAELVRAAAGYYATHAHGSPVMLVHAVTAPNAVLRTLPALPRELWPASVRTAWSASAAVVAAYAPAGGPRPAVAAGAVSARELFERAAVHGDEHAIKLVDTVLDLLTADRDDELARAAGLRAVELIDPLEA
ncbi:questin oxidase family protein [Streptomyces sp. 4N509B]|uniref:questin oxidase family protein n=1 Tax=Streptomyces sp. 4N509B TaxID=3457413 RepID=UPI003FD5273E